MKTLILRKPDDAHLHLRDSPYLQTVLPDTIRQFSRAIVMPNLRPPITTTQQALSYQQRILNTLPEGAIFTPLMTLYLTDNTEPKEIERAIKSGIVHGIKLYPAGATTNSDAGVSDISRCSSVFEAMEKLGLPLLIHGEVTDADIDIFDREQVFIERHLFDITKRFPALKIVLEHLTTKVGVEFVQAMPSNIGATLTPHHLIMNRNDLFYKGILPHHYCLPILKREEDRLALVQAAVSGNPKFFLGTDSAPHAQHTKETDCGCAGIYNSPSAIMLYAEVFETEGALDKLEDFASRFFAEFYGLGLNVETITITKEDWEMPKKLPYGDGSLVPFKAGKIIKWQIKSN